MVSALERFHCIIHTYKNKNKRKEMRREEVGGGGAGYLTHDHAGSKPLFISMSDLSVNIGGIIISCDICKIQENKMR